MHVALAAKTFSRQSTKWLNCSKDFLNNMNSPQVTSRIYLWITVSEDTSTSPCVTLVLHTSRIKSNTFVGILWRKYIAKRNVLTNQLTKPTSEMNKECLTPLQSGHSRTVCARGGPWWSSGWGNWRSLPQTCSSSCPACLQILKQQLSAGPGVGQVGGGCRKRRRTMSGFSQTLTCVLW